MTTKKPDQSNDPKPVKAKVKVTIKDKAGNIATPYQKDIGAWLAKGWVRVEE